ncbi:MAG: 30S ribosomal protein S16 [Planctomycetota bacterium]
MVRIRMTRMGRTHRPFYRINAIDQRRQRDGKVLENLGWYNPVEKDPTKQLSLKADRIKEWLGKGAQPSDTVGDLLAKNDIIDAETWTKMRLGRVKRKQEKIVAEKKAAEDAAKAAAEAEAKAKAEEEAAAKAAAEAEAAEGGDDAGEEKAEG